MPRLAGPASGAGLSPARTDRVRRLGSASALAARLDPVYLPPSGWAGPSAGALVADDGVVVAEPFTDGPLVAL